MGVSSMGVSCVGVSSMDVPVSSVAVTGQMLLAQLLCRRPAPLPVMAASLLEKRCPQTPHCTHHYQ